MMRIFLLKLFLVLLAFVSILFVSPKAKATTTPTPTVPPTNQTVKPISRCLKIDYCATSSACSGQGVLGHRVQLATDPTKPPLRANYKTYLNVCFSYPPAGTTQMRNICTTGDSQLDLELHGRDNATQLKNDIGFIMQELSLVNRAGTTVNLTPIFPPKVTTVSTDNYAAIPVVEWQDFIPQNVNTPGTAYNHRWLAFQ